MSAIWFSTSKSRIFAISSAFHSLPCTLLPLRLQFFQSFTEPPLADGTYEAIGPHFNGNKHNLDTDILVKHGTNILDVPRTFEGIKQYLAEHRIEGIVFWLNGEPMCKIKRSDFGFDW